MKNVLKTALFVTVASLVFSANVYGAADFWTEGACNLGVWNGSEIWVGGANGYNKDTGDECVYDLGVNQTLYLKSWWTKLYKSDSDDICRDTLFYKLSGSETTHKFGGAFLNDLADGSDGSKNQQWGYNGDMSINVISSLCSNVPGDYTIEYWFKARVGNPCDYYTTCNNGSRNYKISFILPGIVLTTTSVKIEEKSGSETVYFTTYGFGDENYTYELSDGAPFAVSDVQSSSLIVTYTGSSNVLESATLTITPPDGKGEAVEVTLEGSTGQVPLPMLGDTLVKNGNTAKLSGYLKYTGCFDDITDFGFYYCTGETCDPSDGGTKVQAAEYDGTKTLDRGELFTATLSDLTYNPATWYGYRSYVVYNNSTEDVTVYSEETGRFYVDSQCDLPEGDTIYFDIDAEKYDDNESACDRQFASIENAITALKGMTELYESKALKRHVVFEIDGSTYTTTTKIGEVTGGDKSDAYCHKFTDINDVDSPTKWLILRAKKAINKPTILHPSISNSKMIKFVNVKLVGDATTKDNAIDLENGSKAWTSQTIGDVANSNLQFIGCYIKSWGFTCLHASAYDLVTFEDCDFEAELTDIDDNAIGYGASAKFIRCSNVKFLRNNFRGSHATTFWIQGCKNVLFMNNVCWNNNVITENVAFTRLVSQVSGDVLQNIGFYYNTMYLANTTTSTEYKVDFFRFGSKSSKAPAIQSVAGTCDAATIAFQFNNCYSYDNDVVTGRTEDSDVYLNLTPADFCTRIRNNNFWSAYDEDHGSTVSVFDLGCYNNYINVPSQVCTTGAEDPSGLVVKGVDLNTGSKIASDVSGLGAEEISNDRLHTTSIRPSSGTNWTVGAYQQTTASDALTDIVWFGGAETWRDGKTTAQAQVAWDNRNNWYKLDGTRVTCVDVLAENVNVIIPEANSTAYPIPEGGIEYYPELPAFSSKERDEDTERIDAGMGSIETPTKFFESIVLEEGSAIKGVENLYSDEVRHYTEATNSFTADRSEWILVGTVIKPFTDSSKEAARNIQSADYYLYHQPHVYMHKAVISDENVSWDNPFTSLEESVDYNTAFAIRIPDEYGSYKLPAKWYYYGKAEAETAGTAKHTYTFNGWFLNDAVDPVYPVSGNTLLCNTYPANINVETAQSVNNGIVKYYDYDEQTFVSLGVGDDEIKSQSGFLFIPSTSGDNKNDGYFRITNAMLKNTSTKYKSAEVENSRFYLKAYNSNGEDGSSIAGIVEDELKSDKYDSSLDIINTKETTLTNKPEVYVMMYDKEFDNFVTPDIEEAIPLGLETQVDMTVVFASLKSQNIESAILEDRETGNTYNLLNENASIALSKGTYTGRFYLNLTEAEEEPLPTDVDDVTSGDASIDIYGDSKAVIISSSENVILKGAEITDMAGRTTYVELAGAHYNKVNISGAQGVYVVKAIGDVMSVTTKVIVK